MFKNHNFITKILLISLLCFVLLFIFHDLMKTESYVIKKTESYDQGIFLTLKSNKLLNPDSKIILAKVDDYTIVRNEQGETSAIETIETGINVLIEYDTKTLSNPPVVKANKVTIQ